MLAFEFQAIVNNGFIKVPDEYINKISKNLKVILLSESSEDITESQKRFPLMDTPLYVENFKRYNREALYE